MQFDSTNIPYGYCQCGCGQKTGTAQTTSRTYGWVKGQPLRFIFGHKGREKTLVGPEPNPSGLCMCGCGKPAPIAKEGSRRSGYIAGKPMRFIQGHSQRQRFRKGPDHLEEDRGYDTPCWIWQHCIAPVGYGQLRKESTTVYAHRHYYEVEYGAIPKGAILHHKCEQRACVRPSHLEVMGRAEHIRLHRPQPNR